MGSAIRIEILGVMPTFFSHCQHCMDLIRVCNLPTFSSQLEEYPEDVRRFYHELGAMVRNLWRDFGEQIDFRIVDTASPEGFWKSIRYRAWRIPTVLINGRKVFDRFPTYEELRQELVKARSDAAAPGHSGFAARI